jgi:hypothetical protein
MDVDECFRKGLIKRTHEDAELAKSLVEMSHIKENAVRTASVNEANVSAYVSLAYDSLREVLEALCVMKGYKVLSHICMGELLREKIEGFDYEGFDRMRWIRNGINYYGEKVEFKQGKEVISKIFAMKNEMLKRHLSSI